MKVIEQNANQIKARIDWTRVRMMKKIALVTGANSGLGKASATELARRGYHVVMLCRSEQRGREALQEILSKSGGSAELLLADLGDMASVARFCEAYISKYDRLDLLVNCAGVITLDRRETKDGFELQFGVNHIGHYLLTRNLLPTITRTPGARIIVVSSGAHKIGKMDFDQLDMKRGYSAFAAYGRSKLCNILFTRELARRLEGTGVTVNSMHPGAVASNIGIDRDTGFGKTVMRLLRPFFQTPEKAAETLIYLATSDEVSEVTGQYYYRLQPAKISKRASDDELARKLWEVSEEIVRPYLISILDES